jgi:hypothetical protein
MFNRILGMFAHASVAFAPADFAWRLSELQQQQSAAAGADHDRGAAWNDRGMPERLVAAVLIQRACSAAICDACCITWPANSTCVLIGKPASRSTRAVHVLQVWKAS